MKINKPKESPAPPHLKPRSKAFWKSLCSTYVFEAHDLERLRIVCEALDTIDACEESMRTDGLLVLDRYGCKRTHPAFATARDARALVLRGLRELAVDVAVPEESRLPRQDRRYG